MNVSWVIQICKWSVRTRDWNVMFDRFVTEIFDIVNRPSADGWDDWKKMITIIRVDNDRECTRAYERYVSIVCCAMRWYCLKAVLVIELLFWYDGTELKNSCDEVMRMDDAGVAAVQWEIEIICESRGLITSLRKQICWCGCTVLYRIAVCACGTSSCFDCPSRCLCVVWVKLDRWWCAVKCSWRIEASWTICTSVIALWLCRWVSCCMWGRTAACLRTDLSTDWIIAAMEVRQWVFVVFKQSVTTCDRGGSV
jgi:hypothetical protein